MRRYRPLGTNGVRMRLGRNGGLLKTGGRNPGSGRPRNPEWLLALRRMERQYPEWEAWVAANQHDEPFSDLWVEVFDALAAVGLDEPPDASKMLAVIPKLARRYGRKP